MQINICLLWFEKEDRPRRADTDSGKGKKGFYDNQKYYIGKGKNYEETYKKSSSDRLDCSVKHSIVWYGLRC